MEDIEYLEEYEDLVLPGKDFYCSLCESLTLNVQLVIL